MMNAASVSATLRRAGFNPLGSGTPRSREGLRVSRSHGLQKWVLVVADLDTPLQAARLSSNAEAALVDLGYEVRRSEAHIFYVTGKATT